MKYPNTANYQPTPLKKGDDAYCVLAKRTVRILRVMEHSGRFSSGRGYLVVYDDTPHWLDSSHFWTEQEVLELIEESKQ